MDNNPNQDPPPRDQPRPASDAFSSWLPSAGLIFLAFNSGVAVYRARDYPWSVAFVVLYFLNLQLLFYCLHLRVTAPPSSPPGRRHLTTAVWFLASFLTVMFSHGVADMMLAVVWCAAALAVGLGFFWLSLYTPDSYSPTDLKDDDISDML